MMTVGRSHLSFAIVLLGLVMGCGQKDVPLDTGWSFKLDSLDAGIKDGWYEVGLDRSSWIPAQVGKDWDELGLGSYDGAGWYAAWFSSDEPSSISLGFRGVDDDAIVWVNGVEVGDHEGHAEPFFVTIPDSLRTDSMLVVVRVQDNALGGGIQGIVSVMPTSEAEEVMRSPHADMQARESAGWVRSAVIYQIYLRSFSDEGTFKSLEARLPELRDLGVTVLWLMPIHPIGEFNRKGSLGSPYAVGDFMGIDPVYGTEADLRDLVDAVHAAGMKIILDLVINHTAWDNDLLIRHPDWYTRDDEGAIVSPTSDWYDVADLNYDQHELRKYMIDVMRYWVDSIGFDGYRSDAAELVPLDFWVRARHELDGIKPVMMLAESALPEHHIEAFDISYAWGTYDILDRLFNGSLPATAIAKVLRREESIFPEGSLHLRFHTHHDKNEEDGASAARWGRDGAMLAATMMFVLPGIPLIYNGEEAGNIKKLPLVEKVLIDWDADPEMRAHYQKLGSLRKEQPWLSTASWRVIPVAQLPQTLLLMRIEPEERRSLLAVLNFSGEEVSVDIPIPAEMKDRSLIDQFTAAQIPPADRLSVTLPPRGFSVLITR